MGLFTQRPQQVESWAELPGEPLRRRSEAELLDDSPPSADTASLGSEAGIASVSIPITVTAVEAGTTDGD